MQRFEPTPGDVLALIEAAVAAPSADNRHHVRFVVGREALEIRTDEFFASCTDAHRRRLTLLSYGAIGENIRVWLRARGCAFAPAWFPDEADRGLLARITWAALPPCEPDEPLAAFVASRHTNRKFFRGPRLTPIERARIDESAAGRPDVQLDWFEETRRRGALLRLVRTAETERFRHREHHDEMFDSIAFEAGWSSPTTERLAPGSLEVEPPLRGMFAALRRWPVMRVANRFGAATMLGLRAGDLPARLSPHVLVVASRMPEPQAALEGGAVFQRIWLAAESLGLALQPMAASAVLREDPAVNGRPGVDLARDWRGLLAEGWTPVMVFRLGRASRPRVRSMRKGAAAYVEEWGRG